MTTAHIKVDFLVSVLTFGSLVYPELPFRYGFRSKLIALPWTICCEMCSFPLDGLGTLIKSQLPMNWLYSTLLTYVPVFLCQYHTICTVIALQSLESRSLVLHLFSGYSESLAFPLNFRMHLSFLEKKKKSSWVSVLMYIKRYFLMTLCLAFPLLWSSKVTFFILGQEDWVLEKGASV